LTALGHEVGLELNFDRIQSGNTFDAHRLASAARGTVMEEAVVAGLFAAYFTEGELLSDHQVLLRVATAAGLDLDLAAAVLDGDARMTDVREDEAMAQELGITGVPYFLLNGKWAIPGAQDVDTLLLALDRAWERTADGGAGAAHAGGAAT
jgi:predicted DsbA family dithiol-disulfide isomerase